MGAANCCRRPDEIIIEDFKDNNQFTAIDQNSYPEDTEQVFKSNEIIEEKNKNQESNQKLYEQELSNSKIGGVYEVAINASNSENNYEEENKDKSNNIIKSKNLSQDNLEQNEREEQEVHQQHARRLQHHRRAVRHGRRDRRRHRQGEERHAAPCP